MGLVYSTESGRICPKCSKPSGSCSCKNKNRKKNEKPQIKKDGFIRIQRETKGRKGKGVTLISGFDLDDFQLKSLMKKLKQKCATGGSLKGEVIEIQGDNRDLIRKELEKEGFKVKISGG